MSVKTDNLSGTNLRVHIIRCMNNSFGRSCCFYDDLTSFLRSKHQTFSATYVRKENPLINFQSAWQKNRC